MHVKFGPNSFSFQSWVTNHSILGGTSEHSNMSTKELESFGGELQPHRHGVCRVSLATPLTHGVHLEIDVSRVDEEKWSSVNDLIIKIQQIEDCGVPLHVSVYSR